THGVWAAALTASYLPGPYQWPTYRCRVSCAMTSKTPTGTVRAPGFYEGTFVRERIIDLLAARSGLDPAEIRRRNLARPEDQPYTVSTVAAAVTGRTADFTGENFGEMFEHALKASRYEAHVARCRELNAAGGDVRYGVGLAAVVETSGTGPFESAKVTMTTEGGITLAAGATSLGQGLATTLAGRPLEAEYRHETTHAIGSFGVHLSVVGVDVTTGEVRPETHFVLCDVGRAINPTIVEGQLVGAVIQGLGHATMEELVYDSS